jgi:hypothetical protein
MKSHSKDKKSKESRHHQHPSSSETSKTKSSSSKPASTPDSSSSSKDKQKSSSKSSSSRSKDPEKKKTISSHVSAPLSSQAVLKPQPTSASRHSRKPSTNNGPIDHYYPPNPVPPPLEYSRHSSRYKPMDVDYYPRPEYPYDPYYTMLDHPHSHPPPMDSRRAIPTFYPPSSVSSRYYDPQGKFIFKIPSFNFTQK